MSTNIEFFSISKPQSLIGPNLGENPKRGNQKSNFSFLIMLFLFLIETSFSFLLPWRLIISEFVLRSILPFSANSYTLETESLWALNISDLCIKHIFCDEFSAKYIAQSSAESPPPDMKTFFLKKRFGSFIEYWIPSPSYFDRFSSKGFLGSKLPRPPEIMTTLDWCFLPLFVSTIKLPSEDLVIFSALSPRVNPGLNGEACFF